MKLASLLHKSPLKKSVIALTLLSTSLLVSGSALAEGTSGICAFKGTPPSDFKYKVVKNLKVGKGTYGSVNDIEPAFIQKARDLGADAVINYNGSQRFGFFPWRMVRPVITGKAIKWDANNAKAFSCTENGGIIL